MINIDIVIRDYESGMSLRQVAKKYNTNHHKIKRILLKNGCEIRQPKCTKGLRKYENSRVAKYGNMKNHIRFDIELDWFLKFDDFEKLKFLNRQVINRDGNRFDDGKEWYKSFIEKFYYDKDFNLLYNNYLNSDNDKYKKPSLDHIIPRSKGGTNDLENLRFITYLENMCKRDMTLDEWENIKQRLEDYFI